MTRTAPITTIYIKITFSHYDATRILKGKIMISLAKQKIITSATSYFMSQYTKHYLNVKHETKEGSPPPPSDKKYLLYMHVPFCMMFCPYCSFNKFTYTKEASAQYFKRLREELLHVKALAMILTTLLSVGVRRSLMKRSLS